MDYRQSYIAQMAGTQDVWEPIWGLKTRLTEVESSLLHSFALRRLQFIHHGGCSYINTQHNATRLQHTIGVFSLVAKFCPDWFELRVAALLHDIGHGPFSHTLEPIEGIDHHKQTENMLYSTEISKILSQHGFRLTEIMDIINGHTISPLRNNTNKLNLDHLDSWVRSGIITGALAMTTQDLLSKLSLHGDYLSTDAVTAEALLKLIIFEAGFHCSSANVGPNTVLRKLVNSLIQRQVITSEMICLQTDAWLESKLLDCEITSSETKRLFYRPHEIRVTKNKTMAPTDAYTMHLKKLYLSEPLIDGGTVSPDTLPSYPLIDSVASQLGTYYVFWDDKIDNG